MNIVADVIGRTMQTENETTVTIAARDGSFQAYRAMPATTPATGVILIAPIFGVTESMRNIGDRYAQRGFLALVPDPFWRLHAGPLSPEERPAAQARGKTVAEGDVMDDIAMSIQSLRAMPECNGTIALAGYCFGGKYAFLAAARGMVGAAAAFHGTQIGKVIGEAVNLTVPLSLHFGDQDTIATMDEVRAIQAALAAKPAAEVFVYNDVGHGFTQTDSHGFDAAATAASERRVVDVFAALP
ncbi:MAG: dienelactone hydrolase family protein [Candidatus Baltobacteraceae bacterium]